MDNYEYSELLKNIKIKMQNIQDVVEPKQTQQEIVANQTNKIDKGQRVKTLDVEDEIHRIFKDTRKSKKVKRIKKIVKSSKKNIKKSTRILRKTVTS